MTDTEDLLRTVPLWLGEPLAFPADEAGRVWERGRARRRRRLTGLAAGSAVLAATAVTVAIATVGGPGSLRESPVAAGPTVGTVSPSVLPMGPPQRTAFPAACRTPASHPAVTPSTRPLPPKEVAHTKDSAADARFLLSLARSLTHGPWKAAGDTESRDTCETTVHALVTTGPAASISVVVQHTGGNLTPLASTPGVHGTITTGPDGVEQATSPTQVIVQDDRTGLFVNVVTYGGNAAGTAPVVGTADLQRVAARFFGSNPSIAASPTPDTSPGTSGLQPARTDTTAVGSGYASDETFCSTHGDLHYVVRHDTVTLTSTLTGLPPNALLGIDWMNDPVRGYNIASVRTSGTGQFELATLNMVRPAERHGIAMQVSTADGAHVALRLSTCSPPPAAEVAIDPVTQPSPGPHPPWGMPESCPSTRNLQAVPVGAEQAVVADLDELGQGKLEDRTKTDQAYWSVLDAEYAHGAQPAALKIDLPTVRSGAASTSPMAVVLAHSCGATILDRTYWLEVNPGHGPLTTDFYFVFRGGRALLWLGYP